MVFGTSLFSRSLCIYIHACVCVYIYDISYVYTWKSCYGVFMTDIKINCVCVDSVCAYTCSGLDQCDFYMSSWWIKHAGVKENYKNAGDKCSNEQTAVIDLTKKNQ